MENTYSKHPGLASMFEHPLSRIFLENIAKLNTDDFKAMGEGKRQLGDIEYFKKTEISGASSRKDLILQSDVQLDGVNMFPNSRIPIGGSIAVGSIFIGHAFHTSAAAPSGLFYNNIIPFYDTNTNPSAGTPSVITHLRDSSTSAARIPEELLSSDFILMVDQQEIFRKNVRRMCFDSRYPSVVLPSEGYQLKKPFFIKENALITAQLLFPSGITVPTGTTPAVYSYFEFVLLGVGFKVKA